MSLTSELKNPESPIRKWFDIKRSQTIDKIINHHNQVLSQSQIIIPQQGTNFPVVGNAVCYAIRKYIAQKIDDTNWHYTSLAWYGARHLQLTPLFDYCINNNKKEDEAISLVILAALEQVTRNSKQINPILQPFLGKNKIVNLLIEDEIKNNWIPTFKDINNIIQEIPTIYRLIFNDELLKISSLNKNNDRSNKVICNATFTLSEYLGGADAQIITNGTILNIKTSAKSRPFTYENLLQQLSYCLLDSNNKYNIHTLTWVYTRHSAVFRYPVNKLFSDINQTRKDFEEIILFSYGNFDGYDLEEIYYQIKSNNLKSLYPEL
ncbi:MAG: hypothetical protein AAFW70_10035 [Cyanobacteria bacterium J06635_10]